MPRSLTGNCSVPITFTPDTDAKASEVNADFNDVTEMLTDSLSRSGKGGMLSALDMGGYKVTNAGSPATGGDLVNKTYADATYATSVTLSAYLLKAGGTMTGNLIISNGAPAVQLTETDASNKNWYVTSNGGVWRVTEDTSADANTRLSINGTVVNVPGSLTLGTDLAVAHGGTGASDAAGARTNLGLGTMATQNANAVAITGGTIAGISALTVAGTATAAQNFASSTATVVLATTGAGTVLLRPNGPGSGTGQAILSSAGAFTAASTIAGTNLNTTGNPIGATWSPWGASDAFSAISARIESRALAYANNAQTNAINQIMPTMAGQNILNVGTYVMGLSLWPGGIGEGQLTAGSNLYCSNVGENQGVQMSGTWRCMGKAGTSGGSRVTLWLRVA